MCVIFRYSHTFWLYNIIESMIVQRHGINMEVSHSFAVPTLLGMLSAVYVSIHPRGVH